MTAYEIQLWYVIRDKIRDKIQSKTKSENFCLDKFLFVGKKIVGKKNSWIFISD